MRITRLYFQNFKGRSLELEIAPVTLLTGENAAGKSACLEALALAWCGYASVDGKQVNAHRDVYDLYGSNGNDMLVGFETDAKVTVERRYRLRDGSVSYSGPKGPAFPAHALDPLAYLSKTGPERLKFLTDQLASASGMDPGKLVETVLANVKATQKPEDSDPAHHHDAVTATEQTVAQAVPKPRPDDPNVLLGKVAAAVHGAKLAATQDVQRLQKTMQGLAQGRDSSELPPRPDAESVRDQCKAKLDAANTEVTRIETELEATRKAYKEAKSKANTVMGIPATYPVWKAELEALGDIGPEPACLGQEAVETLWQDYVERKEELDEFSNLLGRDGQAAAHYDTFPKCPSKRCPHEAAKEEFDATVRPTLERRAAEREEMRAKVQTALHAHTEAVKAEIKNSDWHMKAVRMQRLQNYIAEVDAREKQSEEAAAAAEAQLAGLEAKGKELSGNLEQAKLKAHLEREVFDAAQREADRLSAARGEAKVRAKTEEELAKARAEEAVLKSVHAGLESLREELVRRAVGPLVDKVNAVTGPVLEGEVGYTDGELTFRSWTHRTASDSEKLTIYTALCLALAKDCPLRLVTVARLESFETERVRRLLRLCRQEGAQLLLVEVDGDRSAARRYVEFLGEDWFHAYRMTRTGPPERVELPVLT
jgi:hypothetical protein